MNEIHIFYSSKPRGKQVEASGNLGKGGSKGEDLGEGDRIFWRSKERGI